MANRFKSLHKIPNHPGAMISGSRVQHGNEAVKSLDVSKSIPDTLGELQKSVYGKIVELDKLKAPVTPAARPPEPRIINFSTPGTTPEKQGGDSAPKSAKGKGSVTSPAPAVLREPAWLPKDDFAPRVAFEELGVPHSSAPQISREAGCMITEERSQRAIKQLERESKQTKDAAALDRRKRQEAVKALETRVRKKLASEARARQQAELVRYQDMLNISPDKDHSVDYGFSPPRLRRPQGMHRSPIPAKENADDNGGGSGEGNADSDGNGGDGEHSDIWRDSCDELILDDMGTEACDTTGENKVPQMQRSPPRKPRVPVLSNAATVIQECTLPPSSVSLLPPPPPSKEHEQRDESISLLRRRAVMPTSGDEEDMGDLPGMNESTYSPPVATLKAKSDSRQPQKQRPAALEEKEEEEEEEEGAADAMGAARAAAVEERRKKARKWAHTKRQKLAAEREIKRRADEKDAADRREMLQKLKLDARARVGEVVPTRKPSAAVQKAICDQKRRLGTTSSTRKERAVYSSPVRIPNLGSRESPASPSSQQSSLPPSPEQQDTPLGELAASDFDVDFITRVLESRGIPSDPIWEGTGDGSISPEVNREMQALLVKQEFERKQRSEEQALRRVAMEQKLDDSRKTRERTHTLVHKTQWGATRAKPLSKPVVSDPHEEPPRRSSRRAGGEGGEAIKPKPAVPVAARRRVKSVTKKLPAWMGIPAVATSSGGIQGKADGVVGREDKPRKAAVPSFRRRAKDREGREGKDDENGPRQRYSADVLGVAVEEMLNDSTLSDTAAAAAAAAATAHRRTAPGKPRRKVPKPDEPPPPPPRKPAVPSRSASFRPKVAPPAAWAPAAVVAAASSGASAASSRTGKSASSGPKPSKRLPVRAPQSLSRSASVDALARSRPLAGTRGPAHNRLRDGRRAARRAKVPKGPDYWNSLLASVPPAAGTSVESDRALPASGSAAGLFSPNTRAAAMALSALAHARVHDDSDGGEDLEALLDEDNDYDNSALLSQEDIAAAIEDDDEVIGTTAAAAAVELSSFTGSLRIDVGSSSGSSPKTGAGSEIGLDGDPFETVHVAPLGSHQKKAQVDEAGAEPRPTLTLSPDIRADTKGMARVVDAPIETSLSLEETVAWNQRDKPFSTVRPHRINTSSYSSSTAVLPSPLSTGYSSREHSPRAGHGQSPRARTTSALSNDSGSVDFDLYDYELESSASMSQSGSPRAAVAAAAATVAATVGATAATSATTPAATSQASVPVNGSPKARGHPGTDEEDDLLQQSADGVELSGTLSESVLLESTTGSLSMSFRSGDGRASDVVTITAPGHLDGGSYDRVEGAAGAQTHGGSASASPPKAVRTPPQGTITVPSVETTTSPGKLRTQVYDYSERVSGSDRSSKARTATDHREQGEDDEDVEEILDELEVGSHPDNDSDYDF